MKPKTNSEIVLYQAADGKTRLEVQFQGETAWLSLNQMAELFQRDKSVISKHIKNAFDEGELRRSQLLQNLQQFKPRAAGPSAERSSSTTST